MTDKEKIKNEIERRIRNIDQIGSRLTIQTDYPEQYRLISSYESLLSFIDSLPEESKFDQCIQEGDKIVHTEGLGRVNISQLERVAKKREPVSEDLEEACDNYYDETWDEHGGIAMVVNNCHDIWFPSQATSDFFKAGAEWQKQQMMKNVVDEPCEIIGKVNDHINIRIGDFEKPHKIFQCKCNKSKFNIGDKVKVVIIKEE